MIIAPITPANSHLANPIKYLLAQPDVQFALVSTGMPFGTPWAGVSAAPVYIGAGETGVATETVETGGASVSPRFIVTEDGVAVPAEAGELKSNTQLLQETSTNPASSRKFIGTDSQGPVRVRIEQGHPSTPGYNGPIDPLHTVDHLHIDRRLNGTTGPWRSEEKIPYVWPF